MQPEVKKYLYDVQVACEEDATVWGIVQTDVPALREQVKGLLAES
jgi:hypothetical protein